jgi:hypothetical protein
LGWDDLLDALTSAAEVLLGCCIVLGWWLVFYLLEASRR